MQQRRALSRGRVRRRLPREATPTDGNLTFVAAAGFAVFAAAVLGIVAAWRFRERVAAITVEILTPPIRVIGRLVPGRSLPDRAAIERHVERFGRALGRLAAAPPRRLAVLFALLASAHACSVAALWAAFVAVGFPVSPALLLAVIPTAVLAAVAPVPGGSAGIDVALIALVVSTAGVAAPAASAAVLLYRAVSDWFRLLAGGSVTAALVAFE